MSKQEVMKIIIEEHRDKNVIELLHYVLLEFHLLNKKIDKIMSDALDLQALVDQLKQAQAATKASLDAANISLGAIKTGIGTIITGIPAGGLTAEETAALKQSLTEALTGEQANQAEATTTATAAGDDAAAVAAAQPAA